MAIKKSELYSSIWASCDELRGGMDASQYKDYVLFMLFIKYVSDKYGNSDDFAPPITIPKGASFQDMVALKGNPEIGDKINTQIIQPLVDANAMLGRTDFPDFNDPNRLGEGDEKVKRLENLIAIFQDPALDFSDNRAENDDILGDAYEYLMRHFATQSGKSKGQFYTPSEVSRVIAKVIGISPKNSVGATTAYDPTCGSGSLLLKVASAAGKRITLEGQEKDVTTAGLARMNMILHDFPTAKIVSGNTLTSPKFLDGERLRTYDYVVANPPFSDKAWSTGLAPENDRYDRFAWGSPPAKQGDYIHTYKFHEAVTDNVILDLKYEARDVPQRLTNQAKIDAWFEQKTKGLNNFQKAVLRKRWATMEDLMSAAERKSRIIAEIIQDFSLKPRLNDDRGTAILVAASIYDACHYYRLFQNTSFGPHVGIITSFEPNHNAISREPPNSDERYKFDTYTKHVLKPGQTTKQYEDETKRRFIEEPANMKLLIVVSKLLTGFDAPSCTYIYLDNEIHDHNLFQAICRTNRLDGEDKDYGYIVDFKELFGDVQHAIAVYNSDELDIDEGNGGENNVHIKNWLEEGKKHLDESREALKYLCEPVPLPRQVEQYLQYFCGDASDPNALMETEALRVSFYKAVATFVRAYAAITQHLDEAGYSAADRAAIQGEVDFYSDLRAAMKKHSGEELDIKPYEADMRHLLNTYVQADPADNLGNLANLSLTELIIETGIHDAIARKLNDKGKLSKNAVAEGIINNIRKTIIRDQLTDPRFYDQMSKLLEDLIRQSREDAVAYEEFLRRAEDLVRKLATRAPDQGVPASLQGNREAAVIFNNLPTLDATTFVCPADDDLKAGLALRIDRAIREQAPADWKGEETREREVLNALYPLLDKDREATLALFEIIKSQPGY